MVELFRAATKTLVMSNVATFKQPTLIVSRLKFFMLDLWYFDLLKDTLNLTYSCSILALLKDLFLHFFAYLGAQGAVNYFFYSFFLEM